MQQGKNDESMHCYKIITVLGRDKPGIFHQLTSLLAQHNINIEDVRQSVLRGYLSITILANFQKARYQPEEVADTLNELGETLGVEIKLLDYERGWQPSSEHLYHLILVGQDQVGILAAISKVLFKHGINIETISTHVRNELIYNHFLIDTSNAKEDIASVRRELRKTCQQFGLSMVLQHERQYYRAKRLVVFDLDSTLIQNEIINELGELAGTSEKIRELTEQALDEKIDFKQALIDRASLLKGIAIEQLDEIKKKIKFSPGAKEAVAMLKEMGFKIAVVSSGFSYFTDHVKNELGLDYAFGNELEIQNGMVTGKIKGMIIGKEEKLAIVKMLTQALGLSLQDVIAVGDGSNDSLMLEEAGLGIGYLAKPAAADVADGNIHSESLIEMLFALALPREKIDILFEQRLNGMLK